MAKKTVDTFRLSHVELSNIRGFKDLKLSFDVSPNLDSSVTAVIGRNGTCKTTLLRAIVLGLCNEMDATALLALSGGQLVREGATSARIKLVVHSGGKESERILDLKLGSRRKRDFIVEQIPGREGLPIFVCAYGVGRSGIGKSRDREFRVSDSSLTLFDYDAQLSDPELLLRRLRDHLSSTRYDKAMGCIRRILGLRPDHKILLNRGGGIRISGKGIGRSIPLEAWADGYRTMFTWLLDFYGWAFSANAMDRQGNPRGILLVDEIDQHLHPSHQAALLKSVSEKLPKVQVIVTTHSPMTALGVESDNIVALHRANDEVKAVPVPDLKGYSSDDILTESYLFGTDPYSPATRKALDRHRKLAKTKNRSKKQTEEMLELAKKLDPSSLPSLRDDPIVEKLRELSVLLQKESGN